MTSHNHQIGILGIGCSFDYFLAGNERSFLGPTLPLRAFRSSHTANLIR
jgi:hypothetical protein